MQRMDRGIVAELGAAGGWPGEWAGPHGGTGSAVDDTPTPIRCPYEAFVELVRLRCNYILSTAGLLYYTG